MGYRKFLSFLIMVTMVVSFVSASVFADDAGEAKSYTTESGITLNIPSSFTNVLWPGIDENDPLLAELGINKRQVLGMYNQGGTEIQASRSIENDDDCFIMFIMFEMNTPSNLNKGYADWIRAMTPDSFGNTEMFGYGMTEKNGVPVYRIFSQTSGDTVLRLHQYNVVTKSGKMHQMNFMLIQNAEAKRDGVVPFTDEECKVFDEDTERIINSITLSEELASDVTTPEGSEPFKMAVGEEPVSGRSCDLPGGFTLTIPSDFFGILWPGIEDNDPALAESGYTKEMLTQMYTKSGVEFQASKTVKDVKYGINVLVFEMDAPSDLIASFADKIMSPGSVKATDLFGYGMVEKGGVPLYKIVYQSSGNPGDTVIRLNQYSLMTGSGKMHQINIMLMNDPENKTGQIPYTE